MDAIRYQAAGGVVIDGRNRVLVLRRPSRQEVRLPKGHVEQGETRLKAALREVAEESGYDGLSVLGDLGHQVVRFEHKGRRIVRDEYYYLLALHNGTSAQDAPERQFVPEWLSWEQALEELSFAAEREWVRRARAMQAEQGLGR
jgi:8-oxo-dGTP pyrophosphatase MutT (NUDIX family)